MPQHANLSTASLPKAEGQGQDLRLQLRLQAGMAGISPLCSGSFRAWVCGNIASHAAACTNVFLVTGFAAISPAGLIHYDWDYSAHFDTTQTP